MVVGHVTPEAFVGGTIALVEEGDRITIDGDRQLLHLEVAPEVIAQRRQNWRPPGPRAKTGVLAKFARLAGSASEGAAT